MELVDAVDANDKVLKTIERASAASSDILRVVGILIANRSGELLLQLRSGKSPRYPLHWDCSGGGHVDSGETYEDCAQRELLEEVGIKTDLSFVGKHYIELDDGRKHFVAFFRGEYDGDPEIDPNEVQAARFFSLARIRQMIEEGERFHPECLLALRKYFF